MAGRSGGPPRRWAWITPATTSGRCAATPGGWPTRRRAGTRCTGCWPGNAPPSSGCSRPGARSTAPTASWPTAGRGPGWCTSASPRCAACSARKAWSWRDEHEGRGDAIRQHRRDGLARHAGGQTVGKEAIRLSLVRSARLMRDAAKGRQPCSPLKASQDLLDRSPLLGTSPIERPRRLAQLIPRIAVHGDNVSSERERD